MIYFYNILLELIFYCTDASSVLSLGLVIFHNSPVKRNKTNY